MCQKLIFFYIAQTSMRIVGWNEHPSLQALYEQSVYGGAQRILADTSHVLHSEYVLLPLDKDRVYRVPKYRLNLFKNSPVYVSIAILKGTKRPMIVFLFALIILLFYIFILIYCWLLSSTACLMAYAAVICAIIMILLTV